ncbi:MAG: hypothetical protein IPH53_04420 [Flavobacteriales bacterium]|nr:hypothetical protein [Flavobacteriales bacterium]
MGYHKDGPGYFNYINTINNNSAVTAACMMVQRSKVEAIGGWDEAFSVEYNDVDLCLRLREKGFNNVYLPHVSLYHFESLTRGHPHLTQESYERHLHEVGLFQKRWAAYVEDDPCYNPNLGRGVQIGSSHCKGVEDHGRTDFLPPLVLNRLHPSFPFSNDRPCAHTPVVRDVRRTGEGVLEQEAR